LSRSPVWSQLKHGNFLSVESQVGQHVWVDSAAVSDIVLAVQGSYTGAGNKDLDSGGKDLVLRSEVGRDVAAAGGVAPRRRSRRGALRRRRHLGTI